VIYVLAAAVLPVGADVTPPPGVDAAAYREALREDTFELLDDLANVTAFRHDGDATSALDAMAGATIGAVLPGDVPDLPGLLVGKLFGACEDRPAGVLPARDGRLAGLATRLPVPDWLRGFDLDDPDALATLHARAPAGAIAVGPGWHRLRSPADVAALDPRLEGWAATRALLSGYSGSGSPRT
jgi:hypothetical protein